MVADIEDLENTDASKIHPRRINAKEVLTPQRGEHKKNPRCRWNSKIVRKRPRIPRTTCRRTPGAHKLS